MKETTKRALAFMMTVILAIPSPLYAEGIYTDEVTFAQEELSDGSDGESGVTETVPEPETYIPEVPVEPAVDTPVPEMPDPETSASETSDSEEPIPEATAEEPSPEDGEGIRQDEEGMEDTGEEQDQDLLVSFLEEAGDAPETGAEGFLYYIGFTYSPKTWMFQVNQEDPTDEEKFKPVEIPLSSIVEGVGLSGEVSNAEVDSSSPYNMECLPNPDDNDAWLVAADQYPTSFSESSRIWMGTIVVTLNAGKYAIDVFAERKTPEPSGTPTPSPTPFIPEPIQYIDQDGGTSTLDNYMLLTQSLDSETLSDGWYVVNEDTQLTKGFSIGSGEVNLILCNGKTLTTAMIRVYNTGTLNLYQSAEGAGGLAYDSAGAGQGGKAQDFIINNGSMNLYGGAITGAAKSLVNNSGSFTIKNGSLSGDAAALITNSGTLTIDGGTLSGTKDSLVNNSGSFYMNGGQLDGKASSLVVNTGSFTLNQGTINGGGKYAVSTSKSFTMAGGTVSGAGNSGIYAEKGDVVIKDGTIRDNKTGIDNVAADLTVSGGTIESNTDYGIRQEKDTAYCTMSGGTVTSCNTGVYIDGGDFTLFGGNVKSNKDIGIDITANAGRFTISGTLDLSGNNFGIKLEGDDRKLYFGGAVKLPSGQKIDITTNDFGVFTNGYNKYNNVTNPADLFTCSDPKRKIAEDLRNGEAEIISYASVPYIDKNGNVAYATNADVIGEDITEHKGWKMEEGWYLSKSNHTYKYNRLEIKGNVNLILCDDTTLVLEHGIELTTGNSLTIYCQKKGNGTLKCTGNAESSAGIGGEASERVGNLTVYGGNIYAYGKKRASGIGGGEDRNSGTVKIYGGYVYAKGGEFGAGIGGGEGGSGGNTYIYGGKVEAYGGSKGAGIGGGQTWGGGGRGGYTYIYGGTVYAKGGEHAAGIGGGEAGSGDKIYISGGKITAKAGNNAAGIGGGIRKYVVNGSSTSGGYSGTITIDGGTVYAEGYYGGCGIGGGENGPGEEISINGGNVEAYAGKGAASIGGGKGASNGKVRVYESSMVSVGDSPDNTSRVGKDEKVSKVKESKYSYIRPCTHPNAYYTYELGSHTYHCYYCSMNNKESHSFNSSGKCTKCGFVMVIGGMGSEINNGTDTLPAEVTPTEAPESTEEPTATETPTPEPTATETPTPEPTVTDIPEPEPTDTPEPEPTETPIPEPTETPTPEPTAPASSPTPTIGPGGGTSSGGYYGGGYYGGGYYDGADTHDEPQKTTPGTGDATDIFLWMLLLAGAMLTAILTSIRRRRI